MPNTPNHANQPADTNVKVPTARQLAYLRALASKTGTSFTYPATRSEAGYEITRLKSLKGSGMTIAELDTKTRRRELHDDLPLYSPSIQEHEVIGYSSAATWNQRS